MATSTDRCLLPRLHPGIALTRFQPLTYAQVTETAPQPTTSTGVELVHPIYLDIPMMLSFLAAAQGGYSLSSKQTTSESTASAKSGGGGLKLAGLAGALGFDLHADRSNTSTNRRTDEADRQFTAASLFSELRAILRSDLAAVTTVNNAADLAAVQPGVLVEATGLVRDDAVARTVAAALDIARTARGALEIELASTALGAWIATAYPNAASLLGYTAPTTAAKPATPRGPNAQQKNPNAQPARVPKLLPAADQIVTFLERFAESLRSAGVADYTMTIASGDLTVILPLDTTIAPPQNGLLLDSDLTVLGKVTRITAAGSSVNLLRRSLLSYFPPEGVQEALEKITSGLHIDLPQLTVQGPALQVLPLAIFV
jgi:hypothetical protein